MTLLKEAEAYFAAVVPSLLPIARGMLPDEPSIVLALREYPLEPSDLGFGVPGVKYEYAGLQILVRGEPNEYDEPRDRIEQAYRAGAQVQHLELLGTKHLLWLPRQSPFLLERDRRERRVFAVNFRVQKELSAA